MRNEQYKINNYIEKLKKGHPTPFLDKKECQQLRKKLNTRDYLVYQTYNDCDKVIFYRNELPKIHLYKIGSSDQLRHQDILGSMFALGIDSSCFGDIIFHNHSFYIYLLEEFCSYISLNLTMIGRYPVKLYETNQKEVETFERHYEVLELIVPSLRLDNIVSSITNTSRKQTTELIKNKQVILNYELALKNSYILKEQDVFSIRTFGKYKYQGVKKYTKKGNMIIQLLKYCS